MRPAQLSLCLLDVHPARFYVNVMIFFLQNTLKKFILWWKDILPEGLCEYDIVARVWWKPNPTSQSNYVEQLNLTNLRSRGSFFTRSGQRDKKTKTENESLILWCHGSFALLRWFIFLTQLMLEFSESVRMLANKTWKGLSCFLVSSFCLQRMKEERKGRGLVSKGFLSFLGFPWRGRALSNNTASSGFKIKGRVNNHTD